MKRIGIITFQRIGNYGAELQAYALGAKLRHMGYAAENIDYLYYKHPRHISSAMERPTIPVTFKNRLKILLFPMVAALRNRESQRTKRARKIRFNDWFTKNVCVGREYRSVMSLYYDPPKYDVYMVGSDQIWNPRICSNIAPYFLDFAPDGARCVSYASSFGVNELSGPVFYKYKQWLKRFSYIGLREKSGVNIVKGMALDAKVAHVLDPTLLLTVEDWSRVAIEPNKKPHGTYLLLYDLIASSETVALAKRWANQNGWDVIRIGDGAYGPGEFIWLFSHAEAVVTNSFHGTVFSILHHRQFYSVIPTGVTNAGRIESLLQSLSLSHRLVNASMCGRLEFGPRIEFESVDALLEKMQAKSIDFLKESIEGRTSPALGQRPRLCFACWNSNAKIRAASTSGGVFTLLSQEALSSGGVVYGAAWDDDFKQVHHRAVETVDELSLLRQSKYVYSDATNAIQEARQTLMEGRKVLFSGTPCQCAAMRAAAKGFEEKLVLVDFVCHGTPMAEVWTSYVNELQKRYNSRLKLYEFRNKDRGWNFQNVVYAFENGVRRRILPWLDPYFHGFSINAFLRDGCYRCPFAQLKRISDFTIADCWRVAASNPEYDDNRGTSLVLVNSDKATKMWGRIHDSKDIAGGAYDLDLAQCRNMALMHPPTKPPCHDVFMRRFLETNSFTKAAECYLSWRKSLKYVMIYWIKRLGWFYFKNHQ